MFRKELIIIDFFLTMMFVPLPLFN